MQIEYEPIETAFTYLMKKHRKQKGLSIRHLAQVVGMSHSYLSALEKGTYDTSMDIGFAICHVLDIPVELFIDHMYQIKEHRMYTDIITACKEYKIPVPPQFQRNIVTEQEATV